MKVDYSRLEGLGRAIPSEPTYSELIRKNLGHVRDELRPGIYTKRAAKVMAAACLVAVSCNIGSHLAASIGPPETMTIADIDGAYAASQGDGQIKVVQLARTADNLDEEYDEQENQTEYTEYNEEIESIDEDEHTIGEKMLDNEVGNIYSVDIETQDFSATELMSDASDGSETGLVEETNGAEAEASGDIASEEADEAAGTISEGDLVMANVTSQVNVRTEPSADAELAGVLYSDCGGTVLEKGEGWTKIESGNIVGWVSDEYLSFGDEAQEKLDENGKQVMVIETTHLRVREEPNTDSEVLGHVSLGDEIEYEEVEDEDSWVQIDWNGKTAYINTGYTTEGTAYNTGDTTDEMAAKAQEKAAAADKASGKTGSNVTATVGEAYAGTASDLELLATIIYCEAGNQSYEGKVAVANVVLNRVNSAVFPDSVEAVIRASGQFSPVSSGKFDRMLNSGRVPDSCYEAAQDAMNGISFVGNALYFKNPTIAGYHSGITIGAHVFW